MNEETDRTIRELLKPEEQLLWSGRPRTGILFRARDLWLIPFSLIWTGTILNIAYSVASRGDGDLFLGLFCIPFIIIGLYLIFGRFILDAWRRASTFYGVTNERVIIISSIPGKKKQDLGIQTLNEMSFTEKSNQSGAITFGRQKSKRMTTSEFLLALGGATPGPAFEDIPDVRLVFNLIRSRQHRSEK